MPSPNNTILPGDVVFPYGLPQPTLWSDTCGADIIIDRLSDKDAILIISIDHAEGQAYVLACGSLGYVGTNRIYKVF